MQDKKHKVSITIRVEVSDLAEWQKGANLRGLSISEWIRRTLNAWATVPPAAAASIVENIIGKEDTAKDTLTSASVKLATEGRLVSGSCEHGAAFGLCKHGCKGNRKAARG